MNSIEYINLRERNQMRISRIHAKFASQLSSHHCRWLHSLAAPNTSISDNQTAYLRCPNQMSTAIATFAHKLCTKKTTASLSSPSLSMAIFRFRFYFVVDAIPMNGEKPLKMYSIFLDFLTLNNNKNTNFI